ncbi:MAG: TIGR01212 family radical SAM protein [Smithellaceae bacterium]|nr:TIGR01212 family radical SAM protein [Smithellaceae bacterium]
MARPAFWHNTKRYYDLKSYWHNAFGCNVYKLPIDAGFTCPNRDGRAGTGGCIYCDGRGSRLRQDGALPAVTEQIRRGKAFYTEARKAGKYVAYFQTFTNTYGPVDHLREIYDEALGCEDVIGLSIGTRPDCVPDDVLDLLGGYAEQKHVWLEFGLQSIHEETLRLLNRGHNMGQFVDACERAAKRNLNICVHVIIGLPGEDKEHCLETARTLASLPIRGIKIHSLLALQGTVLGEWFEKGEVDLIGREEYVDIVCDVLEILPSEVVIQRLTADGYREIFLGPAWAINKRAVLNAIDAEMKRRDSHQGNKFCKQNLSLV